MVVADLIAANEWNFQNISFSLPPQIHDRILAIPTLKNPEDQDHLISNFVTPKGFCLALAYQESLRESTKESVPTSISKVWKSNFPHRVHFFLWLVSRGRIFHNRLLNYR